MGEIQGCVYGCVCGDMKLLSLCDYSECSLRTHNIITVDTRSSSTVYTAVVSSTNAIGPCMNITWFGFIRSS